MSDIRISKITKMYCIGLVRLVNFLNEKGINVQKNPNAKISEEHLPLIEAEFGEDLKLRQESQKVKIRLKEIIEPATDDASKTKECSDNDNVSKEGNISSESSRKKERRRNKKKLPKDTVESVDDNAHANESKSEHKKFSKADIKRLKLILPLVKRLIKLHFNALKINPILSIDTNATIKSIDDLCVYATSDIGQLVLINTEYFIGDFSRDLSIGSRVFCWPKLKDTELISYITIKECTYADFMNQIIAMFNDEDINNLSHVLKLMRSMPTFSEYSYFLRKLHQAIIHPTEKNLNAITLMLEDVDPKKQYASLIRNYDELKLALDTENLLYDTDQKRFLNEIGRLKKIVKEFHHLTPICNATVQKVMPTCFIANLDGVKVSINYKYVIDRELLVRIKNNPTGQHDVVLHTYYSKKKDRHQAVTVLGPCTFTKLYDIVVDYINEGNYYYAIKALEALTKELKVYLYKKEHRWVDDILTSVHKYRVSITEQTRLPNIDIIL